MNNKGTSPREIELAKLLNGPMRGIVKQVRLANSGHPAGPLVSIDVAGGGVVPGGHVNPSLSAQQQADEILKDIKSAMYLARNSPPSPRVARVPPKRT